MSAAPGSPCCSSPTGRDLRSPVSLAWAVGLACLAAYLAPDVSTAEARRCRRRRGPARGCRAAGRCCAAPYLLAFATLACVPVRIPVQLGDEDANLLLPLYVVVGSLRGRARLAARRRARTCDRELGPVALPLAAFVAWTGLTLVWSVDLREGAIFVGAFVLPFGLLALGFARLPWRGRWITWLWVALVGTALAYASIGVYQWATRDVFWNPKVIVGNAYAPFFRVNSVFWDPVDLRALSHRRDPDRARRGFSSAVSAAGSSRGSYARRRRDVGRASSSPSRSRASSRSPSASLVAALVVWGRVRRPRAVVLALVLAVGSLAVAAGAPPRRDEVALGGRLGHERPRDARRARALRIALANPVGGVGVGGFRRAYAERPGSRASGRRRPRPTRRRSRSPRKKGFPGLVLFAWLLVAALLAALRGLGRGFTSRVSFAVGPYASGDHRAQLLLQRALRGPDDVGAARARRASRSSVPRKVAEPT